MSAFPTPEWKLFADELFHRALQEWNNSRILGYYGFPGFTPPDPDPAPDKPKPKTCVEILKQHEEAVVKTLDGMPEIEKRIVYRQLNASGYRMDGIDREIYREAQKELKSNG